MRAVVTEVSPITPAVRRQLASVHERSAVVAYGHIFTTPFPRAQAQQRWDTFTGRVALATSGDAVVGFVAWHADELDALYLLPEAAGQGVGGRLIAAARGVRRLWVLEDNDRARAFYERRGWTPSGKARQQWGTARELEYTRPGD